MNIGLPHRSSFKLLGIPDQKSSSPFGVPEKFEAVGSAGGDNWWNMDEI